MMVSRMRIWQPKSSVSMEKEMQRCLWLGSLSPNLNL